MTSALFWLQETSEDVEVDVETEAVEEKAPVLEQEAPTGTWLNCHLQLLIFFFNILFTYF